jgi:hypothetical protein
VPGFFHDCAVCRLIYRNIVHSLLQQNACN